MSGAVGGKEEEGPGRGREQSQAFGGGNYILETSGREAEVLAAEDWLMQEEAVSGVRGCGSCAIKGGHEETQLPKNQMFQRLRWRKGADSSQAGEELKRGNSAGLGEK